MQESDEPTSAKQYQGDRSSEQEGDSGGTASPQDMDAAVDVWAPSVEEISVILEEHRRWLDSDETEGRRANFVGATLQRADLTEARLDRALLKETDLKKADLWGTCLRGAILVKADLEDATATGAHFDGAQLLEASLKNVELHGATFHEAHLQDVNLEGARGLQAEALRGANVSNATLPPSVAAFDGLGRVKDATQYARKLFFTILAACVYCWLTIAMTTDAGLVTNTAASPLPIIGTTIPIVGFYGVAPLTVLVIYVYFQLQLQRLWEELATLPAIFPDGKPLDKKADPWLLTGLVRAHFAHLKGEHVPFFALQKATLILVAWWVVPITLGCFTLRYLPKHDPVGTAVHVLLTVAAAGFAVSFYRNAAATLRGEDRRPFVWKQAWKDQRAYVLPLGSVVIWGLFLVAGQAGYPPAQLEEADLRGVDLRETELKRARLYGADLRRSRLQGAQLQDADLRFARLDSAELSQATLSRARLQGATLSGATLLGVNLQEADLTGIDLRETSLLGVRLREADLALAQLGGADLRGVDLRGALLTGADLRGADLTVALLTGAHLGRAGLNDVTFARLDTVAPGDLMGVDLGFIWPDSTERSGADLRGVRGLSAMDICQAENLEGAKLDADLLAEVEEQCPKLLGSEADQ